MKHKTRKYRGASSKSSISTASSKSSTSSKSLKSLISTETKGISDLIESVQNCFVKDGFNCNVVDTYLLVRHEASLCFQLNFTPTCIEVDNVNRCSNKGTGSYLLKKLIDCVGSETDIKIKIDASVLNLFGAKKVRAISLSALYMLTTPESWSWYNSLGFYEPSYAENQAFIREYRSQLETNKKFKKIHPECNTVQDCMLASFKRIKELGKKDSLTMEEKKEIDMYANYVATHDKILSKQIPNKYLNLVRAKT